MIISLLDWNLIANFHHDKNQCLGARRAPTPQTGAKIRVDAPNVHLQGGAGISIVTILRREPLEYGLSKRQGAFLVALEVHQNPAVGIGVHVQIVSTVGVDLEHRQMRHTTDARMIKGLDDVDDVLEGRLVEGFARVDWVPPINMRVKDPATSVVEAEGLEGVSAPKVLRVVEIRDGS